MTETGGVGGVGGVQEREDICTHIADSPHHTTETNTVK